MSLAHVLDRSSRYWLLRWPTLANAAKVGSLTSAAKVIAAVKIAVTARYFGAGDELDAFLAAFLIPGLFGDTVAGAFTPSLVPGLIRMEAQGPARAHRLASSAAALSLGTMLAIAIVLALSTRLILPVLGSSFPASKLHLAEVLFLGLLFWLPLGGLIAVWRGILNAHGRFALPALGPLAAPVTSIVFLYAGALRWGVAVLVAGTLAGLILEGTALALAVKQLGYPVLPSFHLDWTPELKAVTRQSLAWVASALALSAGALIDLAFAGALGAGAVSALGYGVKLAGVVVVVLATGVATAVLPEFAQIATRQDWPQLRRAAGSYASVAIVVVVPLVLVLMWFSEPLARLFFERGAFSPSDTLLVARVQRFSLVEAPIAVLFAVASRLATAVSANRVLVQAGLAALVVNVIADWFLSRWMGVAGLALSAAVVRSVAVVFLVAMLYRKHPRLFTADAALRGL